MNFYIVWHLFGIIIIYRYFSGKLIVSFRLRRFFSFRFVCIMVNGQDVRLGKNTSELFEPLEE